MSNLTQWLRQGQQVIPGIFSRWASLRYAFLLGVSCYLFLIIFQPFGTYNFEDSGKYLLLMGYGVIFALSYLFASSLLLNRQQWTVRKEFLRMLLAYLVATILNFLYNSSVVSQLPMQWINLLYMGLYTLALYVPIGLIYFFAVIKTNRDKPMASVESLAYRRMPSPILGNTSERGVSNPVVQRLAVPIADSFFGQDAVSPDKYAIVCIAHGSQFLCFDPQDFIFAKSMDNYCEVYFYENKMAKKEIIRITLAKLAAQMKGVNIHRCHRSYLVNFDRILSREGNAKGFLLRFADTDAYALVSRSMLPAVKSYLLN